MQIICNGDEILIDNNVLQKIPYFEALMRSHMDETKQNIYVYP